LCRRPAKEGLRMRRNASVAKAVDNEESRFRPSPYLFGNAAVTCAAARFRRENSTGRQVRMSLPSVDTLRDRSAGNRDADTSQRIDADADAEGGRVAGRGVDGVASLRSARGGWVDPHRRHVDWGGRRGDGAFSEWRRRSGGRRSAAPRGARRPGGRVDAQSRKFSYLNG